MVFESFSFSGKSINCYGLEIVKKKLKSIGHEIKPFDNKSENPVLFSLYWPEQLYDFMKWRYNMNPKKHVIVGGNTATVNPAPLIAMKSDVFLGDGELFDNGNEYIVSLNTHEPVKKAFCENIYPIKFEDVQDNRRTFCEMSRGCRNKCMFCQYGWLKPYRESDIADLMHTINSAKTKSIRIFAADRFQHSKYPEIRHILDKKGKCDTGSDASLKFILKNPDYLKYTRKIRVGIEGMSTKLRKMIGKNYTDDDIVNFCLLLVENNIKCLDFYMIYGLPYENEDDVIQFKNLLIKLDEKLPIGYTIAIHWNAFTPSAQTPFQWASSSYYYNTEHMCKHLFETRENKRIKIMHKPKFTSKWTILRRMLAIRSSTKTVNLLYNVNKYKKAPTLLVNKYKEIMGVDLCGEWPLEKVFPWDKYVIYDKDKMKSLYTNRILKQQ